VELHRSCKMSNRDFLLMNPSETIRKVLAITRLDRLFVIEK
jgi:anti-anti-sigma regulatory factor